MKVAQSCLTLCDPMDYTVHGILQARILEWVAYLFSSGSSRPRHQTGSPALQEDSLPTELFIAAAAAKSHQSCSTLCNPTDGSPPASRLRDSPGKNTGVGCHFLLQCVKVKSFSCVRLFTTPWTVAHQAPPSMGFSRQEYWSGLPLPSLQ